MLEKIKNYALRGIVTIRKQASRFSFASKSMKYISLYALLLIVCCLFYLTGWAFIWFFTGEPHLESLLKFIHEIASASWIAVIGFIAQSFVDKNNNGIPDEYEKEKDESENKKEPRIKHDKP